MIGHRCRAAAGLAFFVLLTGATPAAVIPSPVEGRVTVAPGVSIRVIDGNRPGAATVPVVLISGWSTGAEIWSEVISNLSPTRRVIAFDPRSQGASTVTLFDNTPEQRAADLAALLKYLGVERPVLVGWSQGAQDVAAYVSRFGTDGLAGVVMVDAAISEGAKGVPVRPFAASRTLQLLDLYQREPRPYLEGMFRAIIKRDIDPAFRDVLIEIGMKTPPSIGAAMIVADLLGPDRTDAVAKIRVPTLIVASAQSPDLERQRATAEELRCLSRFEVIAEAGHAVFIDQPERFSTALQDFLHAIDRSAGHEQRVEQCGQPKEEIAK